VAATVVPAPSKRSIPAIAAGYAVAGATVLWLGFWVSGREPRVAAMPEARALVLYEPAGGTLVERPVDLLFRTSAPLRLERQGWVAGDLHVHAMIDGVAHMPGAADIQELGPGRFRYRLSGVGAGTRTVQLVWAGRDHVESGAGASAPVTFQVR
jgi:hypothetical protein